MIWFLSDRLRQHTPGDGGGGAWVNFCWVRAAGLSGRTVCSLAGKKGLSWLLVGAFTFHHYTCRCGDTPPLVGGQVYSVANYRPHLSHFWANTLCHFRFRDPNLVTFYFYELTHFLDWMKNTLVFIYSTNILARLLTVNKKNRLTPQKTKMSDPILVTPLQMRPRYSRARQFPTFEKCKTENRRLTQRHTIGVLATTMSVVRW